MTVRCFIVDDNQAFLAAARGLLQAEGISVAGTATNGAEALRRVAEVRPDVTLVDANLGDENGFDVARRLAETTGRSPSRVIVISTYAEEELIDPTPNAEPLPFLSKTDLSGEAIRAALGA